MAKVATISYLRELALNALEDREVEQIIEHYNRRDQLELSGSDRELLRQRSAGNPLYLKVALDEISASGIAVGQLALSVQALFAQILQRLQHKYGDELLNRYLGLIAAGRSGLPEKELKEMLGVGDDIVLSLTKALSNFVISRRGLLNFFHPEFERNIMMRIGKRQMRNFHQIQADYFIDKGYAYARALENLPYQLQQGERYEHLLKLLTDLEFLEAKTNAGMVNDLSRDFDFALHSFSVAIPETVTVSHRSGAMVNRSTIQRLGRTLDMNLAFIRRHPQCLLQMMWNYGYWYDAPAAARHYDRTASDDAPWEQQRSEHYRLLENWRECQEGSQEFAWLQAIHPLPERIDSPLLSVLRGHDQSVYRAVFSQDGSRLASGDYDGTVRIWESKTGEVLHLLIGHQEAVKDVCFSPDGSKLASGSWDGTIHIWDAKAGELLAIIEAGKKINGVAFNSDGSKIAAGCWDRLIRIWNVADASLKCCLRGHESVVNSAVFSADGRRIVSASIDRSARIWDVASGDCLQVLGDHGKAVNRAVFSPGGERIATGSDDGMVRIWDSDSGELLHSWRGHDGAVQDVNFSPNGSSLVSGGDDRKLRLWNSAGGSLTGLLSRHDHQVNSVEFSADGAKIVSGSADHTLRLWKTTGASSYFPHHHPGEICALKFIKPERLVTAGVDGTIYIWDARHGTIVASISCWGINSMDANVNQIVAGGNGCLVWVWDANSGQLRHTLAGHIGEIEVVVIAPDGAAFLSGSADKTMRLWDSASGCLIRTFAEHNDRVSCAAFSADARRIASGAWDETVRVWDAYSGKLIHSLAGHVATILCVAWSADGSKIASGSYDHSIRLWDAVKGELIHLLSGHRSNVESLAFSDDGNQLISCSRDRTIKIWDVVSGDCRQTIAGQGNVQLLAKTAPEYAYQVIGDNHELKVIESARQTTLAFFPGKIQNPTYCANLVAGYNGNYIYLFQLLFAQNE